MSSLPLCTGIIQDTVSISIYLLNISNYHFIISLPKYLNDSKAILFNLILFHYSFFWRLTIPLLPLISPDHSPQTPSHIHYFQHLWSLSLHPHSKVVKKNKNKKTVYIQLISPSNFSLQQYLTFSHSHIGFLFPKSLFILLKVFHPILHSTLHLLSFPPLTVPF